MQAGHVEPFGFGCFRLVFCDSAQSLFGGFQMFSDDFRKFRRSFCSGHFIVYPEALILIFLEILQGVRCSSGRGGEFKSQAEDFPLCLCQFLLGEIENLRDVFRLGLLGVMTASCMVGA